MWKRDIRQRKSRTIVNDQLSNSKLQHEGFVLTNTNSNFIAP